MDFALNYKKKLLLKFFAKKEKNAETKKYQGQKEIN